MMFVVTSNNIVVMKLCVFTDEYFSSRLPFVMKRVAQGGVRLAMILNKVFNHGHQAMTAPT